jgi:lipoate-protein ligase A
MTGLKLLDKTYGTAAENLACDEALLDACDSGSGPEVLRFWEPEQHFVVLGYANKAAVEANLDGCRERHVPVLRRCSGGGAVLQGPGCLNYSLILRFEDTPALQSITDANCSIMKRNRDALSPLLTHTVAIQGTTDLTVGGLKFSGNSQRRKKRSLLFHGTFLVNFDLDLVQACLRQPSKEPDYRQQRSHSEFLTNLKIPVAAIKGALQKAWPTVGGNDLVFESTMQRLTAEKYSQEDWNLKW